MKKKFVAILTTILFVVLCFALSACSVDIEHTHTFSADDGDCTTADTCTVCQLVLTAKVHAPSANWSKDATNHWKECANEGCTKLAVEKTNHTPNADDSNCTTAITCSECSEVTTEAKEHDPSANWSKDETNHWKGCTNSGCTSVLDDKANHTPNVDDGDCTTAVTCTRCNEVMTAKKEHYPSANWSKDDTEHWKECTNEDCTKLAVEKTNHTPNVDDGDCTTAVTCTRCNEVMTAAKEHDPSANWSKDETNHWKWCTNSGCTSVLDDKASHTRKYDSNACECGHIYYEDIFEILEDGTLVKCTPGNYKSITIPNSVTSIGDGAFSGCSSLTSIDIPNSVTNIGDKAFSGCSSLTSIVIPNSVTNIGDWAFTGCSSLTSIVIPDSVTNIGDWAFYRCSSLTSIEIPNSVTSIGYAAFAGCSSLTSIEIPNTVTSIGEMAFAECSSLTSITVAEGNKKYHSAGNSIIEKATKTLILGCKNSIIPTDGSVTSIGDGAFSGCSSLTSIEIPNSVTIIGYAAFAVCSSLTSIVIPNSVTNIGNSAFSECSSLTSITLPSSVTSIGNYAFSGCSSLTSITLPSSVTIIGYEAFSGCSSLANIIYSGTTAQWKAIIKGSNWNYNTGNYTVTCTNGTL